MIVYLDQLNSSDEPPCIPYSFRIYWNTQIPIGKVRYSSRFESSLECTQCALHVVLHVCTKKLDLNQPELAEGKIVL